MKIYFVLFLCDCPSLFIMMYFGGNLNTTVHVMIILQQLTLSSLFHSDYLSVFHFINTFFVVKITSFVLGF